VSCASSAPGSIFGENGLRVLDALGVLDRVIAGTSPASRTKSATMTAAFSSTSRLASDFPPLCAAAQALLTALYDGLLDAGGEVAFASRAVGAAPCGTSRIRRWLFGCGRPHRSERTGSISPIRDSLDLLRWRRPVGQFAVSDDDPARAGRLVERDRPKLIAKTGMGHGACYTPPATVDSAYVQLTSLEGDEAGNRVPIDRDFLGAGCFPGCCWVIDRLPDDGRGDWFEAAAAEGLVERAFALVGDGRQRPAAVSRTGRRLRDDVGICAGGGDRSRGGRRCRHRHLEAQRAVGDPMGAARRPLVRASSPSLPPRARTAAFKAIDSSEAVKRVTLFAGARHDPTAEDYWHIDPDPSFPYSISAGALSRQCQRGMGRSIGAKAAR